MHLVFVFFRMLIIRSLIYNDKFFQDLQMVIYVAYIFQFEY